jgi:hypothetical protein
MNGQRVLFAVLDWGLGHATRSVPLVLGLLSQGCVVTLASRGKALQWLGDRFPALDVLEMPQPNIRYSRYLNGWRIASQGWKVLSSVERELAFTADAVERLGITHIYSDNCYGVRHPNVESTLITHQLNLPVPRVFRRFANHKLHQLLRPFDRIWVPDYADFPGLGGWLSHGEFDFEVAYIGPQSHLQSEVAAVLIAPVPLVALISGLEPHRSLFLEQVLREFTVADRPAAIFTGAATSTVTTQGKVTLYGHASAAQIKSHLLQAEVIVCRSGYSSLMDLHALGLTPTRLAATPGQWEQVYLARLHAPQGG